MRLKKLLPFVVGSLLLAACAGSEEPPAPNPVEATPSVTITATPTQAPDDVEVRLPEIQGDEVPVEFTCDGADTPPRIEWDGPAKTKEWIVTLTDPDAPGGTFVHWVVFGIPAGESELSGDLPKGAREAATSFGSPGYGGPCPPEGDDPHGYIFTVTALSRPIDLPEGAAPEEVQEAAQCCVIGSGRVELFYVR